MSSNAFSQRPLQIPTMEIRIITESITADELALLAGAWYGDMIKGVVDIEREIVALGGEFHMDANTLLTQNGSRQDSVWGFNIHLNRPRGEWIEFTSLINIRPTQKNRGMLIEDKELQKSIRAIVNKKII